MTGVEVRALLRTPLPWLAGLLTLYLVVPILWYVRSLAGAPASDLTAPPEFWWALFTSAETATISTITIAVLGIPLGYVLSCWSGPGSTVVTIAVQLPLVLPSMMSGLLLLDLVGPHQFLGQLFPGGLTMNLVGIVLGQTFVAAPIVIVAARSAFAALDPALEDVATTLGHSRSSRFAWVSLRAAAPGIIPSLLLSGLFAFGESGATRMLAYYPHSVSTFTSVQFGSAGPDATLTSVGASLVVAVMVLLAVYRPRRRRHLVPQPLPAPRAPTTSASPRLTFDLTGRFGSFLVEVAHTTRTGRHLAILGPSGSGKSLTMRMLTGLLQPTGGRVCLDGVDVTALLPEHRGFGYVPQDVALLPHLPVWHQVMFGVGTEPGLAAYWIGQLGLTGLEDRMPAQLSGGQRRRVALARALASNPRLLLLDAPFTGLDLLVRDELRRQVRQLQRDTAITTVIVTHDPVEAALLADEVLILNCGRLEQAGPQPEVFAHPASPTAARLLGIRNLQVGRRAGPGELVTGQVRIGFAPCALPADTAPDADLTWCIRPEHLMVEHLAAGSAAHGHPGTVCEVVCLGAVDEVLVALDGGLELTAQTAAGDHPELDARCRLTLPPVLVMVWPGIPTSPSETSPAAHRRCHSD